MALSPDRPRAVRRTLTPPQAARLLTAMRRPELDRWCAVGLGAPIGVAVCVAAAWAGLPALLIFLVPTWVVADLTGTALARRLEPTLFRRLVPRHPALQRALADELARRVDADRRTREVEEAARAERAAREMRDALRMYEADQQLQREEDRAGYRARADAVKRAEQRRVWQERLTLANGFDALTPRNFELAVAQVFERLGYEVEVTQQTRDGGRDIIARRGEERLYIECKRYAVHKRVGRDPLMKLVGALPPDGRTHAVTVTTSSFTKDAKTYAKQRNVRLVDRETLVALATQAFGGPSSSSSRVRVVCTACGDDYTMPLTGRAVARCPKGHDAPFSADDYTNFSPP